MNKITADHLARRACIYIRQSTPHQVRHNLESQRRQYGLADRARALGWQEVDVIDDDLGISGSGTQRPGFERLLRALCNGQIGAVFSIEASFEFQSGSSATEAIADRTSKRAGFGCISPAMTCPRPTERASRRRSSSSAASNWPRRSRRGSSK